MLCPKCEERLNNGEITEADVKASFVLAKIASQVPALDKLTLKRAYRVGDDYVLVFNQGEARLVLTNKQIMNRLREALGNVWVTEHSSDPRQFLESLLYPIRLLTVNIVWLPDGTRHIKAIIAGQETSNLPVDLNRVKEIVKIVMGDEVEFEFERARRPKKSSVARVS
ncbi:MAG: hypothetical protein ACP5LW_05675 [Nitrososphaeria archaeon]